MLRHPGREIGLKVDRIEELREIRPKELSVASQGNYAPRLAPMLPLPQAPDFGNHVQQFDVDLRRSRHQTWPGNHGVCIYH